MSLGRSPSPGGPKQNSVELGGISSSGSIVLGTFMFHWATRRQCARPESCALLVINFVNEQSVGDSKDGLCAPLAFLARALNGC